MISMTGYGYCEKNNGTLQLAVEIKSWNNRYLDISVSLPPFLSPLETHFRDQIKKVVSRGKVEVSIRLKELEEDIEVILDMKVAESYLKALSELEKLVGKKKDSLLSELLGMEGVLKLVKNRDSDLYREQIDPLLSESLAMFMATRRKEGEETEKNIRENLLRVKQGLAVAEEGAGTLENKLKETLQERFKQLLNGEFDEQRILSEIAVLLMKYGIGEELSRLAAHIRQFEAVCDLDGPAGKKLDFICQEMNREVNTIGSKNSLIEIGHAVVEMKESIENIREQLRNVE
jgi:uncharacterized protein (TIGR00255 family)